MNCLQCGNEATDLGRINGYDIRECVDGHRTGQLSKTQEKEIMEKLRIDLDADGNVILKTKKARKQSLNKKAA